MTGLTVPQLAPGAGVLTAALAYADGGWYVGPVRRGTKHPGSVLGKGWQTYTSREPEVLAAWFAGTDHGVFLHCGRSGAVVFDVDTPENLHPLIAQAVTEVPPPFQTTRPDQPGRRHYVYAVPPGRTLGNGLGRLRGGWGEVRGRNGVIVVAPTVHPDGGRYKWGRVGVVPVLPDLLGNELDDGLDASDAATDAEVIAFLDAHQGNTRPELLEIHINAWQRKVDEGESRHDSMTGHLSGAMKEARLGYFPAEVAADTLQGAFSAAVSVEGHGRQGHARTSAETRSEWRGLLAWAVAQARAADLDEVRARVAEKVPDLTEWIAGTRGVYELVAVDPDPDAASEAALEMAAAFAREVEREAYRLRVREAGREKLAAQKSTTVALPVITRLDQFLAIPDESVTYRVDRLWPVGGRIVLAAQHKAGKSTLVANLIRALVDDESFLDAFAVAPVTRVIVVDNELDERMLRRWLRDQGIRNADRVNVVPLRGRLSSFNILDPVTRTRWTEHLGRADVLIFDCLRPALDALALSEDKDAGRFLEALDELTTEAGIPELAVVHHMGHVGERSRGDSRILDWPDAVWRLVKDAEDEDTGAGQVRRYLTGYGRDVDVAESQLGFDPVTRHLSVAGGTRSDRRIDAAATDVLASMAGYGEPLSGRAIEERMRDVEHNQKAIRAALHRLVDAGQVVRQARPGRGGGFQYTLSAEVRQSASEVRQRGSEKCVSASLDAQRTHYADDDLDEVRSRRTSTDESGDPPDLARPGPTSPNGSGPLDDCAGCGAALTDPPPTRCGCPDLHAQGVLT